ncbi:MAG: SurA N-terminal domain-containing protein [Alphaproteobacteria bacterium]|nr:SurA N-terminal domain-containing protein [Alphaproteobacteria bacterium]
MLEALHHSSKSWVVRILFALLIISFGAWGIGDVVRTVTSDSTAVEVGPVKISIEELVKEFDREVGRLRPLFGGKLTSEQAREMGLLDRTLDQMVARTLYQLEAKRLGLSVGEKELQLTILGVPAFQGEDGKFNKALFQGTLADNNWSESAFLNLLRSDIARGQLLGSVTGTVHVPKVLSDLFYRFRFERRVADILLADADAMPLPPAPKETELAEFHQANAKKFTSPEIRSIQVMHMTQDALTAETKPSDAEIEEEYRVRIEDYTTPEKRIVLQMLLGDEDKAKAAAQQLSEGGDFAKIAKSLANMDDQAILLGRIEKRDLPGELAGPAFALEKDGVSAPIKSPLGWHILKVTAISPASPKPLSEVKSQIAKDLALANASKALSSLSAQIVDEVAGGARIEEAAQKYKIKLLRMGPMDAKGNDLAGKPLKNLPAADKLLELAFSTPEGADSNVIELDDGILGVKVEKVVPAALKPLSEVMTAVRADWNDSQRRKTAEERAAKGLERLKAGASLASVAQEFGFKMKSTAPFLRDAPTSETGLPSRLVASLFKLKPGESAMSPTPEGAMIVRLGRIVSADPTGTADNHSEIAQALEQGLAGDLLDQFTNALAARYGVNKHSQTINNYFNRP